MQICPHCFELVPVVIGIGNGNAHGRGHIHFQHSYGLLHFRIGVLHGLVIGFDLLIQVGFQRVQLGCCRLKLCIDRFGQQLACAAVLGA
ncbi:hypothetical protein D3C87_1833060 [compost metagenome]